MQGQRLSQEMPRTLLLDLDMAKYIDADRLRAEIENLIERYGSIKAKGVLQEGYKGGRLIGYEDVLNKLDSLQQEQPEVDYNKFEKLFDDFCERNKGHHITVHDACMWFWELGLNARKED